jgi:hypothetical protein
MDTTSTETANAVMTTSDERTILALRLLLARAANADSLAWWEDESLTQPADYVLHRLFPVQPATAARRIALQAAETRHQAALQDESHPLCLYWLDGDNRDRLALRFKSPADVPLPAHRLDSVAALKSALLPLTGGPMAYTVVRQNARGGLLIRPQARPATEGVLLHRAKTLAWAYLEGKPGAPIFPFCLESAA